METNKTPIQELIESYSKKYRHVLELLDSVNTDYNQTRLMSKSSCYREAINDLGDMLEKEKEFAFDCFQAGNRFGMDVCGSFDWGQQPTKPDFDEFYSKYVSQHTK